MTVPRYPWLIAAGVSFLILAASCCGGGDRRGSSDVASLGAATAPVVLVVYTDYQCPSCREFVARVLPELRRRFVDSGRLRIIMREAISSVGARAPATAARCAGEFGKYWPYVEALSSLDSLGGGTDERIRLRIARSAANIGVPADPFARCMASTRYAAAIDAGSAYADSRDATGAATFFIGRTAGRLDQAKIAARGDMTAILDSLIRTELER